MKKEGHSGKSKGVRTGEIGWAGEHTFKVQTTACMWLITFFSLSCESV